MSKAAVIYWSSTGNTEAMANAIVEGAKAAGAEVSLLQFSETSVADALAFDVVALGCPAMGAEELDDAEVEPFFAEMEKSLSGHRLALFGSYDWGDGEWMRTWYDRANDAGAVMIQDEGLIANNDPDEDALEACRALGKAMAQ